MINLSYILEKITRVNTIHNDIRSCLRLLDSTKSSHLHFGYWTKKDDDFVTAQENLFRLIKSYFPHNARNILDIGGGIGGTSNLLTEHGYNAVCIVPDKELIAEGINRFPKVTFVKGTAEFFRCNMKFDIALLIESYSYFTYPSLALANITNNLKKGARIVILNEFSLTGSSAPRESDLLRLLAKRNFVIENRIDITKNVLPTCECMKNLLSDKPNEPLKRWETTLNKYLSGEEYYLFLMFSRA